MIFSFGDMSMNKPTKTSNCIIQFIAKVGFDALCAYQCRLLLQQKVITIYLSHSPNVFVVVNKCKSRRMENWHARKWANGKWNCCHQHMISTRHSTCTIYFVGVHFGIAFAFHIIPIIKLCELLCICVIVVFPFYFYQPNLLFADKLTFIETKKNR